MAKLSFASTRRNIITKFKLGRKANSDIIYDCSSHIHNVPQRTSEITVSYSAQYFMRNPLFANMYLRKYSQNIFLKVKHLFSARSTQNVPFLFTKQNPRIKIIIRRRFVTTSQRCWAREMLFCLKLNRIEQNLRCRYSLFSYQENYNLYLCLSRSR